MLDLSLLFVVSAFLSCGALSTPSYFDIPIEGDCQNGFYISTFVGTPPQQINFLLDTGSSNVAVAAVPSRFPNVKYYSCDQSRTFRRTSDEIHLRYVQGDWKGFIGTDIVNPCLSTNCSVTVNIGCMTSMEDIFDENSRFQGILGLAFSSISKPTSSIHPFLNVFIEEYGLKNVFSLDLGGPLFSETAMPKPVGNFRIGLNSDDVHNYLFTPIVREWYYEITVLDLKVGNRSSSNLFKCQELNNNKSIIDSGTSELLVPKHVYDFVISEVKNYPKIAKLRKFWHNETVICLENEPVDPFLFPDITLSLYHSRNSSFDLRISPELYLLPVANTLNRCARMGIQSSSFGVVIGSAVLRGFSVLFDRVNGRVGFVENKRTDRGRPPGAVSTAVFHAKDFDLCLRDEYSDDGGVSPMVILLLIGICVVAVLFLYALLSWIWKYHILGGDNRSDTSSLIEDND